MIEAYLIQDLNPAMTWLVLTALALIGIAHGMSKAFGFYAAMSLYGWPNGIDHRPLTHGILCVLFMILCFPLVMGSFVGFYLVYGGVELLGDRFPFIKRFDDYCMRVATDWHKSKEEGRKQPPGWLLWIA